MKKVFREAMLDGFLTRHELPDADRLWSDRGVWRPIEEDNYHHLYLVKCIHVDSDQEQNIYYYVCHLDKAGMFREENNFASVIDHNKYHYCYWSTL
jgi:hypothetical protein